MNRLDDALLMEMAQLLAKDARDEMAIPSYLHKNRLLRWMAWRRVEVLADYLAQTAVALPSLPAERTLMDFGCGTGILFPAETADFGQIYGVDIVLDAARLHLEKRSYPTATMQLYSPEEAHSLIPDHSLDVIIAAEVLEHITPLDDTLAFFRKKLCPHGRLLITVPTENKLYQFGRRLSGFEKHFHVDNAASIHKIIQSRGFHCQKRSKVPLPAPLDIYWLIVYAP
ncbi:MAG TPA: methyltransferase domain-containing protein [Chloroflexota bacterium]|nr:methyltransferase domain-containing protein [Chloroflexota bacterium]HUM71767.1 methyltransferase domain-containing protein [Chloroflexota bacterium]